MTPSYNATKAAVHQLSESIRLQLADTSVKVLELVPPAVATELLPGQDRSPFAMPLDAFADETMALIAAQAGRPRDPRREREAAALRRGARRLRTDRRDAEPARPARGGVTAETTEIPRSGGRK
ncbi:SDR family NAD(P)-dependent oxidoreductase [Microbacterium elymi]|uniref:SDR family NAD(P)-dependent oxidoreductase n=1 Tax=Microbacterium elymi TaxID=2909587 RepID=UPI003F497339